MSVPSLFTVSHAYEPGLTFVCRDCAKHFVSKHTKVSPASVCNGAEGYEFGLWWVEPVDGVADGVCGFCAVEVN